MTTTLERPTAAASPAGRAGNGRRALVRWAWRLYRREWRQQVLAVALLIVAVGATTVGLGLVGNVVNGDRQVFGTADSRMDIDTTAPGVNVPAEVAQARQLFGTVETIEHVTIPIPGSITPADVRAEAEHGPFSWPQLHVTGGSYPAGPGQVAVTSGLAATFHLRIGSTWPVLGQTLRVVGTVENSTDLQDDFALVAPGQLPSPRAVTMLFDTHGHSTALHNFRPAGVQGIMTTDVNSAPQRRLQSLLVLVLSTIGMVFVGLLAVAGFTVMAQRRMRALGMVGAIGATDRQVRLVILANGIAVGTVGAVVGTAAGLAAWFGFRPAFEHLVGHRIDSANVQWWAVAVDAALAVLTAVVAAWWPARSMARLPIVAALSGRPASPRPAHRFALSGCVLLGAGFGLLVWARPHATPVLVILGIVTSVGGMLLIAPLGIRVAAAGARRAPVAIRLALRDLGRYQARSGAALAAVSLAIGIAATIAVNAQAQNAQSHDTSGGNLPPDQVSVSLPMSGPGVGPGGPGVKVGPGGAGAQAPTAAQLAGLDRAASTIAADVHATATATVALAVRPDTTLPGGTTGPFPVVLVQRVPHGFESVAQLFVATPDVLAMYHIAPSSVRGDIITSRHDLSGRQIALGPDPADLVTPTVQVLSQLPSYSSAPNTLITPAYAAKLGLQTQTIGRLLQSSHSLTEAEVRAAISDAAAAGVDVESRNGPDHSLQHLRDYSTAIGVLVALGVLLMTVGLIRSETANDLRTLSAAGATGSTRRTLTSATAGTLALLGGVLGTAGCYLAMLAWNVRDLDYLAHPPVLDLLALILGLPLAAVVLGWLTALRPPAHIAQRPLD